MILQRATHDVHKRVHRHTALGQMAAGTIKPDDYRRVLARSYGFYVMAEELLGLSGRLTACLGDDLGDLGMTPAAISELPRCTSLAIGQHQAELTGARYVLLGASLGGKVMARAIAERTNGHAALPVRFLSGMGDNDWKTFAANLEDNLPDAASRTRAAKAAKAFFTAYEEWMTWDE